MADSSKNFLEDLLQRHGNNECADCGMPDPEWASYNIGVFLCSSCAVLHRGLGVHISKVKSVKLDKWEENQIEMMDAIGNLKAQEKYEQFLPPYYRRPTSCTSAILKEQWVHAKYSRSEFVDPDRQCTYCSGAKEGYLWKRGRAEKKYHPRKFVLSSKNNTLMYYTKENAKAPKGVIYLDNLNAVFVPEKMSQKHGLQLMYEVSGSTRNIFVYAEAKEIVDWFYAIRAAKLERRRIAFPDKDDCELTDDLTCDFLLEGWLRKTGPREEPFKKRWFTLDKRKLMYYDDPLDAYPLGEIFVGQRDNGYTVTEGAPDGSKHSQGHCLTLKTPQRLFLLSAESQQDMCNWVAVLNEVIDTPLTPQEHKLAATLVSRRTSRITTIFK